MTPFNVLMSGCCILDGTNIKAQSETPLMQTCVCVHASMCESLAVADTLDHTHIDWYCSTSKITKHYYAGEDGVHFGPSPTHTHTFYLLSGRTD